MLGRIATITQTYNRPATVGVCLPAWAAERDAARAAGLDVRMHVHDDGSTDSLVPAIGRRCADAFWAHDHIVDKNKAWGVAQGVRRSIELALRDPLVEWVYVCDSDTYPAPGFWGRVAAVVAAAPSDAYSFYNSSWHAKHYPQHDEAVAGGYKILLRETSPGCSFLMRASRLREMGFPYRITSENHVERGAWDFILAKALGPVAVTWSSLVEHFGAGGIHNASSFDIDRALRPVPELAKLRDGLIQAMRQGVKQERRAARAARAARADAEPTKNSRREAMPYDPRAYWAEQFRTQGYTYVASSRGEYASQADAFFEQLSPRIDAWSAAGGGTILDYGCGVGRLAALLRMFCSPPHLCSYVGADINVPALEHARKANPGLPFVHVAEDCTIPLPDEGADLVIAATVLQHVPEAIIARTCAELRRLLAPRGRVLLIEDANPEGLKPAPHMSFRMPERYAGLLGLRMRDVSTFTAERHLSHYLVELG